MMNKIEFISDYFIGTRAFYLFQFGTFFDKPEFKKYILDKKNLNASKIALISNIMLGIKEDVVDNKGNLVYQSKLFLSSLERSVNYIATRVDNGYKIGNYIAPDAATVVAIVRNKLAHGMYTMDLDHNRVILHHKGTEIILNIDDLTLFIVDSFANTINQKITNIYERNIGYFSINNTIKDKPITDINEIQKMIKRYNVVKLKIESKNSLPISVDCIYRFELFLKKSHAKYTNFYDVINGSEYKELEKYLLDNGCIISYCFDRLKDKDKIDNILKYARAEIINNSNLNYMQQIEVLGYEVLKNIDSKYNNFNAIASPVNNLVILQAITKTGSINEKTISRYISKYYSSSIKMSYDEFGLSLISMFNALFMYLYDDVYCVKGEYTFDRSEGLDFAKLDLSMVNPIVINIDNTPLVMAKERVENLKNKQTDILDKITQQENNLSKVTGNEKAESIINNNLSLLRDGLSKLISKYVNEESNLRIISEDYSVNWQYFRNKTIIEGIRNSIAHGHYEFIANGEFADTIIIFNDIYEGELTFQAKLTFGDLEQLINNNYEFLLSFVENKKNLSNANKLIKK